MRLAYRFTMRASLLLPEVLGSSPGALPPSSAGPNEPPLRQAVEGYGHLPQPLAGAVEDDVEGGGLPPDGLQNVGVRPRCLSRSASPGRLDRARLETEGNEDIARVGRRMAPVGEQLVGPDRGGAVHGTGHGQHPAAALS